MHHKHYFSILLLTIFVACATSSRVDYRKMINNTTFSDVHRNPQVVESEYFEFKGTSFTYTEIRKKFEDNYFKKISYQGIYVILDNNLLLTVQKVLYCDREVIGMNKTTSPKRGEPTPDPDRCTYSYYDVELLKSRKLLDSSTIKMAKKYKIVKTASTTKIEALGKKKGKVYEAKDPLTY